MAAPSLELAVDPTRRFRSVGQGLSILVAEDNQINALLIRSLLGRLGHDTLITTNGAEALESWLSAKPWDPL